METPNAIQFFIHPDEEGGYTADAIGYSIYTQGETLDEIFRNIKDAVECHFEDKDKAVAKSLPIMVNYTLRTLV